MPTPSDNVWVVSIYLDGRADQVRLTYGSAEHARAAEQRITGYSDSLESVTVEDAIGNTLTLMPTPHHTVLIADLQRTFAGNVTTELLRARFQQVLETERKAAEARKLEIPSGRPKI